MSADKRVTIALATYNGSKYIEAQMRSIADQSYENITTYVRDDGSSDDTVEIVKRFILSYQGKKRFILMKSDKNLGVPYSFYEILTRCEPSDYYAFCDQDDIWYRDKIKWAVEQLSKAEGDRPAIYYSRCDYRDDSGALIRVSPRQEKRATLNKVIYHTPASGFTCVFNEALRDLMLVRHKPGDELHDRYFIRGAVCFGTTVYDDRCTAAHIRHASAVTAGDSGNRDLVRQFLRNELMGADARKEKSYIAAFYRLFRDELSPKDAGMLALFSSEDKGGVKTWMKKVFFPHRLRERLPGELALRLLFVIKKV